MADQKRPREAVPGGFSGEKKGPIGSIAAIVNKSGKKLKMWVLKQKCL
jgi:hypothetical protein